jgi:tRNA(fMet)-specific endonuclease VapC
MTAVIVDSDVASFMFKKDTRADLYKPHLAKAVASISFMTLAELEQWTVIHGWSGRRRNELLLFIKNRFVVIDSNAELCRKWAEVRGAARRAGRQIETSDAWIAATALVYSAPLITHNAGDFEGVAQLTIISEKGGQP